MRGPQAWAPATPTGFQGSQEPPTSGTASPAPNFRFEAEILGRPPPRETSPDRVWSHREASGKTFFCDWFNWLDMTVVLTSVSAASAPSFPVKEHALDSFLHMWRLRRVHDSLLCFRTSGAAGRVAAWRLLSGIVDLITAEMFNTSALASASRAPGSDIGAGFHPKRNSLCHNRAFTKAWDVPPYTDSPF